jgi:hypothetical protein
VDIEIAVFHADFKLTLAGLIIKVKLFLCLTKDYTKKAYGERIYRAMFS